MVQALENWAILEGTVQSVRPSDVRADLDAVELAVDRVAPLDPYPNLLAEAQGAAVAVIIPRAVVRAQSIEAGVRIRCRARRASPFAIFASPDDLTVLSRPFPRR